MTASRDFIARSPTHPQFLALQASTVIQQGFQLSVEIAQKDLTQPEVLQLRCAHPVLQASIATPQVLLLLMLVATAV